MRIKNQCFMSTIEIKEVREGEVFTLKPNSNLYMMKICFCIGIEEDSRYSYAASLSSGYVEQIKPNTIVYLSNVELINKGE